MEHVRLPSVDAASCPLEDAGATLTRAHALWRSRQDAAALAHVHAALAQAPERADAWTLLGLLQQRAGLSASAEAAYRAALQLNPDYADAWTNLGTLLRERGDRPGALAAFQQAMRAAPGTPDPVYNLGVALEQFGDHAGALLAFEAAIECAPQHVDAHWNLALALLREGHLEQGLREYEWRFRRGLPAPRACAEPVWDGAPLHGRTLLVWAEQGLGDMLQFLRFVPELARCGGRIVLEVPAGLVRLVSRLPGVDAVVARGSALPPFDTQIALMSLPFALGTKTLAPTASTPYLHADARRAAQCRAALCEQGFAPERELAVGLVWAGNPTAHNARERSPGLPALRGLLDLPGLRWCVLQQGAGRAELAAVDVPKTVIDLDARIADFDDTAACIAALDLVVTCDTAVAHLAGALGKPTFLLLPSAPDWRHGMAPDTTPWYPNTRLFRQHVEGDWTGPCDGVAQALVHAISALLPRGCDKSAEKAQTAPRSTADSVLNGGKNPHPRAAGLLLEIHQDREIDPRMNASPSAHASRRTSPDATLAERQQRLAPCASRPGRALAR